jgi:hypothetical protein
MERLWFVMDSVSFRWTEVLAGVFRRSLELAEPVWRL